MAMAKRKRAKRRAAKRTAAKKLVLKDVAGKPSSGLEIHIREMPLRLAPRIICYSSRAKTMPW